MRTYVYIFSLYLLNYQYVKALLGSELPMYIQLGKPTQNAFIERYNRTVRHEWLDMHLFETVEQAQLTGTQWLWCYNNERSNTAIGGVPPSWLNQEE